MNSHAEELAAQNDVISEASREGRLVTYLRGLAKPPKNGAALANLRRGLGRPPKKAMEMFPYLSQFLANSPNESYENAIFIVAALFAYHDEAPGNVKNLGASLRKVKDQSGTTEKRFVALLNADEDELPYHLRQIIGLLKSKKDVPINWQDLLFSVANWNNDGLQESVQYRWAKEFWKDIANDKKKNKLQEEE